MRILRNQSGQGMTEYIIIVAVVALAGIAAFSYFGKTIRGTAADMSSTLAGTEVTDSKAKKAAADANTNTTGDVKMSDYEGGGAAATK